MLSGEILSLFLIVVSLFKWYMQTLDVSFYWPVILLWKPKVLYNKVCHMQLINVTVFKVGTIIIIGQVDSIEVSLCNDR